MFGLPFCLALPEVPATQTLSFRHVVVDAGNPPDPHCKAVGDMDGDGYADLLAASASGGGLWWYRYPDWTKHRIAEGSFTTDMAVADIDRDGHLDVIIPSEEGLMWYRNPRHTGQDATTGSWQATNIGREGARMHDVEVADLNGDGKPDIVTRHQSGFGRRMGNAIHLWIQETPTSWRHRSFACPHGEGLTLADINGDGRKDVVIGGRWYENPGEDIAGEWKEHTYVDPAHFEQSWPNGDVVVQVGDINGDGKPDIVLTQAEGTGRLSWFEPPADLQKSSWTEHVIEPIIDHSHGLALGDLDRDGQLDIVVAKMHQATAPQEIRLYRNRGQGVAWDKQVIATTGSHNIVLVDVGRKGRLSIFGANWSNASSTHGALELWINEGVKHHLKNG